MDDKQIVAMQKVVEALGGLDEPDLRVVLGFIGMRYGGMRVPSGPTAGNLADSAGAANGNGPTAAPTTFSAFHDLYHAANPETESEKALVAGYWVQVCQQNDGFDSFTANSALKGMGYTVSNITRALDALMAQEPKYVMQIKKSGTARQARKVYKLTTAGLKRVVEMLNTPKD